MSGPSTERAAGTSSRGRQRREQILDALERLLKDHTLAEIDVDAIARLAGIKRSGFYFYFATKGAAVAALIEGLRLQLMVVGHRWFDPNGDASPRERAGTAMFDAVAFWRRNARLVVAMFDAARADPEVSATWNGMLERLSADAARRITDDGAWVLAVTDDIETLARVLIETISAAMERDVRTIVATGDTVPGTAETLTHIWTAAVYGPSSGP